eukprot:gb/GEZN01003488.1/.p1 GENE.gb/GEZN01003488.1/~~gb/GEZN01003488.1/.p1  ORF type:complete len:549 (+),score=61.34 gb/GEZN01003488.1/:129-1775(+)
MQQATPTNRDGLGKFAVLKGDSLAVVDATSNCTLTWKHYIIQRNRMANALLDQGIKPGVRVVLYGLNSVSWLLARSATEVIACCVVPMNWHLAPPEVGYILDDCDAEALFVDESFLESLHLAFTDKEYGPRICDRIKLCVVMQTETSPSGHAGMVPSKLLSAGPRFVFWQKMMEQGSTLFPDIIGTSSVFMYSGGTSGKPKAAVREDARVTPSEQKLRFQRVQLLNMNDPNQVQLVVAPMYHAAPFAWSSTSLNFGGTLVVMRRFHPENALELIHKYRVTCSFLPPIVLKQLVNVSPAGLANKDFSSVKSFYVGGAPTPQQIKVKALQIFGPVIYEFYGSSELGFNSFLEPHHILLKPGSCGKVAPGVTLRVCDDEGNDLPRGQVGLLYSKLGDQALKGYHKSPEKFKESLHPKDPTWFSVGDVASLDDDDFLYICDRKIDMIISGGANIYPAEVEQFLHLHPAIADVAVFGVPDELYGERVHAAILLKPNYQPLTVQDLRSFCNNKIAAFKLPKEVSFHTDFPRTPTGKLLKRKLRDGFWKNQRSNL